MRVASVVREPSHYLSNKCGEYTEDDTYQQANEWAVSDHGQELHCCKSPDDRHVVSYRHLDPHGYEENA